MAQHIRVEGTIEAPPQQVFNLFADHERFGKLMGAPMKRVKDSPESNDPNGVGSVRRIDLAGGFEETVLVFDPPRRIEYSVSKGGPIKNHIGKIVFEPVAGGTRVTYTIEFDAKIPFTGGLIAFGLRQAIQKGMKRAPRMVAAG